jgi:hypothetical protein
MKEGRENGGITYVPPSVVEMSLAQTNAILVMTRKLEILIKKVDRIQASVVRSAD